MSLSNFRPTIWSRELNWSLKRKLVAMNIVNQDWIGEILNAGDKVKITRAVGITTGTYTPGSNITVETATSSQLELTIDQFKYFAFSVDSVDEVQANIDLFEAYTKEADYSRGKDIDEYIFGLYTGAHADNVVTKTTQTSATIYDKIVDLGVLLDNKDVDEEGRFLVLDPKRVGMLSKSPEFIAATSLGDGTKRRGFQGSVAGFDVYKSNSLTTANDGTDDVVHCVFGHPDALTFGVQHIDIRASEMELQFADLVKGLTVYGAKMVKSDAFGDFRVID
jgi:hypothetical protein